MKPFALFYTPLFVIHACPPLAIGPPHVRCDLLGCHAISVHSLSSWGGPKIAAVIHITTRASGLTVVPGMVSLGMSLIFEINRDFPYQVPLSFDEIAMEDRGNSSRRSSVEWDFFALRLVFRKGLGPGEENRKK